MGDPKLGKSKDGKDMHYSVGALIERSGKYLLIDRKNVPLGFACLAGHVDEGETAEQTLLREVEEESGLKVEKYELVAEEMVDQGGLGWGKCVMGVGLHYYYLYRCRVSGKPELDTHEAKSIGWFSVAEIKRLVAEKKMEPVWKYWLEKLGII
jgi:ADP-ribose pyrophosphatase YjhB (NUDIX family)